MTDDLEHGLGWVESPTDGRDFPVSALYAATAEPPLALPSSYHVPAPLAPVLDQGSTPMCVAYSAAGEQLWFDLRDSGPWAPDEPMFFRWIGGTPNGAVIRDALAMRLKTGYPPRAHADQSAAHRIAAYYAVPVARADVCAAILALGPIVLGTPWAGSWFRPVNGVLPPFDSPAGGHAILAVGWDATGLRLRNSWGSGWGQGGEATLPWGELHRVREAWKAVDSTTPRPVPPKWAITVQRGATVDYPTVTESPKGTFHAGNPVAHRKWAAATATLPCSEPQHDAATGVTFCYVPKGMWRKWVHAAGAGVSVKGS